MRFNFLFLIILCSAPLSAQTHKCDAELNHLKIFEFMLTNLDSIQKHTPEDGMYVSIDINKNFKIEKTTYGTAIQEGNYKTVIKSEVTVWQPLDDYIRSLFPFCPSLDFKMEEAKYTNVTYQLPLKRNDLKTGMEEKRELNYIFKEPEEAAEILPYSNFSVQVSRIRQEKVINTLLISSELNFLESNIVEIIPNCFLIFKLFKSSNKGKLEQIINYKVYDSRTEQNSLAQTASETISSEGSYLIRLRNNEIWGDGNRVRLNLDIKIQFEQK